MSNETQDKKGVMMEFGLSSGSLRNSTSVLILTFLIVCGGILAYSTMPKELFPEVVMPQIYVRTVYPGNSPVDIENLITRQLEKQIKPLKGINEMTSTSVQDNSIIIVEFNTDVPVEEALSDVKDAVDKAKSDLPSDLDMEPMVMDVNMSEMPVMNINLSGDYSVDDLKDYAEMLQEKMEVIPEISAVNLRGALDREININVDVNKMELVQVSFSDIESAIGYENMSISGGDILMDKTRRTIRVSGEYTSMDQIANTIVKAEFGNIIYLRDIATVEDSYKERTSYARLDGNPVVSLDIVKKSGENLLNATDQVAAILKEAKENRFPSDLKITITNDQSNQVRGQLLNLENSIYSGVILVVIVLLFFLGLRNALFVGIAIPLSMLMSFMILGSMGITINMMVLFALILALGMLVDNGIVTIENIYRLYSEGMSKTDAAKYGVGEIAIPIISSTATTLAAFAPLLFWDSIMGEFMKFLPITLIVVLGSSLFVGLVVNPVLAALFMKHEEKKRVNLKSLLITVGIEVVLSVAFYVSDMFSMGTIFATLAVFTVLNAYVLRPVSFWFQGKFLVWLENIYVKTLRFSLTTWKPIAFLLSTIVLLFASIALVVVVSPDVEFFPANDPKYINIFLEAASGTDIEKTNTTILGVEKEVQEIIEPYRVCVNSVVTNIGSGSTDPRDGPSAGETPNKAKITISFKEFEEREGISTSEVMKALSENLTKRPGIIMNVQKNREGPPAGKPINIEVSGEEFETLIATAEKLKAEITARNIPGVEGLKIDLETGKPEILVNVDRARARMFGLSTAQIGGTLRTALFGKEISKYKEGEDEYPIMLKLKDDYRYDVSSLLNQRITFRDMTTGKIKQVPISAVADISFTSSYGAVKRRDQDRTITIWSNVIEGYNATNINAQIQEEFGEYQMPDGYSLRFTGESEEQEKASAFLGKAFLIAIALIFLILVSQFNSGIKPIIIVGSVAFSTIGVFLGIIAFGDTISVIMTGIGIVSLAGIVVNNAIVLIDYIDLTRARRRDELGMPEGSVLPLNEAVECIVESGKTRLRPVLLTAITTVLGLLPLATGMNINFYTLLSELDPQIYFGGDNVAFWGPMAWTVVYGLTFATFLTLILVPVMYLLVEHVVIYFTKPATPGQED
ncbi:MAG: efflux RND transporter permease subunit [Flavobacteriales bacterium]|nr:efflux RND transporter permease subunit [Flavobacteriales bacterium]